LRFPLPRHYPFAASFYPQFADSSASEKRGD
jgi:hypothetical protein